MDIRINPVGFSVNPVLEEFINKKFSKLEKYHDGIMSIDVTLKLEKDDHLENKLDEVRVDVKGQDVFANSGRVVWCIEETTCSRKRKKRKLRKMISFIVRYDF